MCWLQDIELKNSGGSGCGQEKLYNLSSDQQFETGNHLEVILNPKIMRGHMFPGPTTRFCKRIKNISRPAIRTIIVKAPRTRFIKNAHLFLNPLM